MLLPSARNHGGCTMTKADIIEGVYEKVGFSKKESAEIVELVFDTVKETLERGDKIKISGFGNFQVRHKNARVGRNPQTGREIEILRAAGAHLPPQPGAEERAERCADAARELRGRVGEQQRSALTGSKRAGINRGPQSRITSKIGA